MIDVDPCCSIRETAARFGQSSVIVPTGSMRVIGQPLFLFLLFSQLFCNLDVIIEYCGNDGDHVGLDNSGPDALGSPDTYVDDTLEGQIPLPHVHHIFTPSLLQDADQTLDSSIDSQDISNTC